MGITDIWNELLFFCIDTCTYTKAEQNQDKYKKIVSHLDKKLEYLDETIEQLKNDGDRRHEQLNINSFYAGGEFAVTFTTKEGIAEDKRVELIGKMSSATELARQRRGEAESLRAYWEGEVADEERRLRNRLWGKQEEKRQEERRRQEKEQQEMKQLAKSQSTKKSTGK